VDPRDVFSIIAYFKGFFIAVGAGVISVLIEKDGPCTPKQLVSKLFASIVFALFVVFLFADGFVWVIERVFSLVIEDKVRDCIVASLALAARDILIFVKESTPKGVRKLFLRLRRDK
jgi:hypothetical protein